MRADARNRHAEADAAAWRLRRLMLDGWALEGMAVAARYRARRIAARRQRLAAVELAWDREGAPRELVELRALEQVERDENALREVLSRLLRARALVAGAAGCGDGLLCRRRLRRRGGGVDAAPAAGMPPGVVP